MLRSGIKNMQVRQGIIQLITVNVMDNLTGFRACNFPVFPLATASLAPVTKPKWLNPFVEMTISLFNRGTCNSCNVVIGNRGNHFISSSMMLAVLKAANLLLVGIQSIAVISEHLIVAHAKSLRYSGPVAVFAGHPDRFSTPSIIKGPMLFEALVVHKAESMRGVLSSAPFNVAYPVLCNQKNSPKSFPINNIGNQSGEFKGTIKIIGNSWAVPKFRWLGERIAMLMPQRVANDNRQRAA